MRQVQEHGEPGRALDECADRRAVEPDDQVAFPVPRDGAVLNLLGSLADHDLVCDVGLLAPLGPSSRDAQGATRA
jgi:hypothetical protein